MIIIRATVSILVLCIAYSTSMLAESLNLPLLLVIGFVITQAINETISHHQTKSESDRLTALIKSKNEKINSLKNEIHSHLGFLDKIHDSGDIPIKQKNAIRRLKSRMFSAIGYKNEIKKVKNVNNIQSSKEK